MIIIYDDHLWSPNMMLIIYFIYDDHMWWSYIVIRYHHQISSSYVIITCDDHMWSSYEIIIYDHRIWSSCLFIIINEPSFVSLAVFKNILTQSSVRLILAFGVAGIIILQIFVSLVVNNWIKFTYNKKKFESSKSLFNFIDSSFTLIYFQLDLSMQYY